MTKKAKKNNEVKDEVIATIEEQNEAIATIEEQKEAIEEQNEQKKEKDVITALLEVLDNIDTDAIKQASNYSDTELMRSNVANLVIEIAHKLNELKSVKKVSTMRELMYSVLAHDTQKSINLHRACNAQFSKTLEDIKNSESATLVFSTMYSDKFKEIVK